MSGGPFGRRGEPRDPEPEEPETSEAPEERELLKRPPREPVKNKVGTQITWVTGAIVVVILIYVTINTFTTDSHGSRGVTAGQPLPPFAAPLALANTKCDGKECDASVRVEANKQHPTACSVRGPNILNSCQLSEQGPVVLAFLVAPSKKCIDQVDQLNKLAPRFPDVQFAAVAIKGKHKELNNIIREHGWKIPVAYDHDGAIANAFAVAVCPSITFAKQGGGVETTTLGTASDQEIIRDIRGIRSIHPRSSSTDSIGTATPSISTP